MSLAFVFSGRGLADGGRCGKRRLAAGTGYSAGIPHVFQRYSKRIPFAAPPPLEEKREKHRRRDMEQRLESAEVELAHLRRAVDDLSDVVVRQSREIDQLARRVGMLLEREAEREAAGGGSIPLADQRPPHW